jgi:hypothetical protein
MALQPPLDRPAKRSTSKASGKLPPLTGGGLARAKIVQKGPNGIVFVENTRGKAIPRSVSDQRKPMIASRSLGGTRKRRNLND